MEVYKNNLDWVEGRHHNLLQFECLPYSDCTIRRAYIVWMNCGMNMEFRDVCNYYHRLEALELEMSMEQRAQSRRCELYLYDNPPPTSSLQRMMFPNLYNTKHAKKNIEKIEAIRTDQFLFNMSGYCNVDCTNCSRKEAIRAHRMVTKYCKDERIPLQKFLITLKTYMKVAQLKFTVRNILNYMLKKSVNDELELNNITINFDFLNDDETPKRASPMLPTHRAPILTTPNMSRPQPLPTQSRLWTPPPQPRPSGYQNPQHFYVMSNEETIAHVQYPDGTVGYVSKSSLFGMVFPTNPRPRREPGTRFMKNPVVKLLPKAEPVKIVELPDTKPEGEPSGYKTECEASGYKPVEQLDDKATKPEEKTQDDDDLDLYLDAENTDTMSDISDDSESGMQSKASKNVPKAGNEKNNEDAAKAADEIVMDEEYFGRNHFENYYGNN